MRTFLQLYRQVLIGLMKLCATEANKAAREKQEEGIGGNKHGLLCIANDHIVEGGADKE